MTDRPRRKSDAARRANQVIRGRTMLIMLLLGVASFTVLFWKLYDLQINRHDELKAEAVGQQTDSMVISASRGTIYDKNGEIMAISYSTETVLLDPGGVQDFVESQEQKIQDAAEEAAEKGAPYTAPEVLDQAYIARGLSRILDVEEETILTAKTAWKPASKSARPQRREQRRPRPGADGEQSAGGQRGFSDGFDKHEFPPSFPKRAGKQPLRRFFGAFWSLNLSAFT